MQETPKPSAKQIAKFWAYAALAVSALLGLFAISTPAGALVLAVLVFCFVVWVFMTAGAEGGQILFVLSIAVVVIGNGVLLVLKFLGLCNTC